MYTVDEITKMLETQSQEDIVKNFTDALNAAAKRKAEQENTVLKAKAADEVMEVLINFLHKYYPEWGKVTVTGKDLIEILDSTKFFTKKIELPNLDPLSDFLKKHKL